MDHEILLLARIVEHATVGIVLLKADGVVHYANLLAQQMLGCHREDLIGKPLTEYVSEMSGEVSWEELLKRILNDKQGQARVLLQSGKRETIICKLDYFHVDINGNQQEHIALIFRDITSDLRLAEQLEKKNLETAKMNSELIRSNSELKRVSELKSNFLSIASHELKTPLTSIKGYSDIIIDNMQDKLDSGIYRMVESINRAADRLHKVVNNILDVTRIEQKRLRLKPEMLELGTVAKDCIEELSQFSIKRSIVFNCDFPESLPHFYGDRMRMQQVFTNLFSNAIKYSPDGSAVEVRMFVENHDSFHVIVKDHGIGIDKSEQKNIFDPFYEVGSANRHSTDYAKFMGGGTGLGLSIVKGIIDRHGGRIWVESEGVKENSFPGSAFHIILPMQSEISWDDDETKAIILDRVENTVVEIDDKTDRKPTILFIDSDREAVEIARMVLENAFEIFVAETGEEGLRLAFQHYPSVILMDSYLPGLDGYRICRILRSQEETRETPIAFFSAGTQNDEIQMCFANGADDFIVKPFNGRELVDKIWRLLMKKKEEATFK
ncbi:MAG: response regulator [Fibrobacter sp.]|jgi:two-component system sensor histidine kinase ChiS|nr:response regulator [Fibrobacter sp.]